MANHPFVNRLLTEVKSVAQLISHTLYLFHTQLISDTICDSARASMLYVGIKWVHVVQALCKY